MKEANLNYTCAKLHLIRIDEILTVVVPVELVEDVGAHLGGSPWQTSPIINKTMQQTNQCRDDNE